MYCLQIFLIFLLFLITFSIHVPSLHSKPYREINLSLNKSNHIMNRNIFWPPNENNWKLHSFIAYHNRKWKEQANQRRFKKRNLSRTNNIQPNLDPKRNQFEHDILKKSNLSIPLYQKRQLSKLDQGSQQNQNSVKIQISGKMPCTIPKWVNQKEIGKILPIFYFNPCQPDPRRHCEFIYKNFILKDKFIQCDKSGKALVKSCPQNFKFDSKLQKCSYSYILLTPLCPIPTWVNQSENGTKLPPFQLNPCSPDITRKCEYKYVRNKYDDSKFIQCDKLGNAIIKSCPPSFKWDDKSNLCSLKTTTSLSIKKITTLPTSNENEVETTRISYITSNINTTRGTNPPCLIPDWVNQNENGTKLLPFQLNPCSPDITRKCEYKYIRNKYDDKKFIQCDKLGNAIIKSCPPSFKWDNKSNQCSLKTTMKMTSTEKSTIFSSRKSTQELTKTDKITAQESTPIETPTTLSIKETTALPTSTKSEVETTRISYITSNINPTRGTNPPCLIPDWDNQSDNGTELPHYYINPCKSQPTNNCKFNYKQFLIDDTKFIQCDRSGNARLKSCPISFRWDNSFNECLAESVITTNPPCLIPDWDNQSDNGTELPDFYINPCKSQPSNNCKFNYKEFLIDDTKFIQCDKSGNARLKSCPTSFRWDNSFNECLAESVITTNPPCLIPDWVNQSENGTKLPPFQLNPCSPDITRKCEYKYIRNKYKDTQFIQCDKLGNAIIMSCPPSFKWDNKSNQCSFQTTMIMTSTEKSTIFSSRKSTQELTKTDKITAPESTPIETPTTLSIKETTALPTSTESEVETTRISYITSNINSTRGTNPPCLIPDWDNQSDNGTELPHYYINPCKSQPTNNCKFNYKQYLIDDTKFIQCDRSGNARLKSCPTSFRWDNTINQCLLEIITTMKIPCLIPSGVNHTEEVSSLPPIYPNPCPVDRSRACEFSFKPFLLDPHKFIKCDKFGKASLKSCQVSFRWFQTVQQCLPQCQIPDWVNQNEQGTPLPPYYPNPCAADPNRICLFIYKPFFLDQHKFILCDKDGHGLIKSCPPNFKWVDHTQKCSIENVQCEVPAWVNEKEKGRPLEPFYPNPCVADSSRKCEFIYLLYVLDKHKFIQCDRFGNAVVKSCPPHNIWNNHIKQCSIQNIMTTLRPKCSVPNWMNPNEMGLALPSHFPNPCISTSIQTCKYFTYVKDDHKFIECDHYGKAWVKSCPPISKWDITFRKCTAIING